MFFTFLQNNGRKSSLKEPPGLSVVCCVDMWEAHVKAAFRAQVLSAWERDTCWWRLVSEVAGPCVMSAQLSLWLSRFPFSRLSWVTDGELFEEEVSSEKKQKPNFKGGVCVRWWRRGEHLSWDPLVPFLSHRWGFIGWVLCYGSVCRGLAINSSCTFTGTWCV